MLNLSTVNSLIAHSPRWKTQAMGYWGVYEGTVWVGGVWVIRAMGYKVVDCIIRPVISASYFADNISLRTSWCRYQ